MYLLDNYTHGAVGVDVGESTILPSSSISGIPSRRSSNDILIPKIVNPSTVNMIPSKILAAKLKGINIKLGTNNKHEIITRDTSLGFSGEIIAPNIAAIIKDAINQHIMPTNIHISINIYLLYINKLINQL